MESPVDQIYAEAVALLDRRLDETWQEEEVIAQLKETRSARIVRFREAR